MIRSGKTRKVAPPSESHIRSATGREADLRRKGVEIQTSGSFTTSGASLRATPAGEIDVVVHDKSGRIASHGRQARETMLPSVVPTVVAPSEDVMAFFSGDDEILEVDVQGHMRWLETGEGDPWPAKRG